VLGRRHVLGQVEIVEAKAVGDGGDADIEVIGQAGQNRLLILQDRGQGGGVGQVGGAGREGGVRDLARVDAGDRKACLREQFGSQMADLSKAENGDLCE